MIRNDFRVNDEGDIEVLLTRKKAKGLSMNAILDRKNFDLINKLDTRLYPWFNPRAKSFYVMFKINNKADYLHRFLTECPKGLVVDHINHDTLDNRSDNLRVVTYGQNNQNRKGAFYGSLSGELNVVKNESGKWTVVIKADGQVKCFGSFSDEDKDLAVILAKSARKKYLPYSKEFREG